jgi:tetratricopeptide (TPR) repeat protein
MNPLPLASGLALAPGAAAPPRTVPPDREAARLHDRHLARGRALLRKKQYHPAIEQFAAALEAWPDEPQALLEMGRAALLAGDLTTADSATRGALAALEEPASKAAALHQMALVADKRGDRPAALEAARQSLRLREDRAVRQWLTEREGLGPGPKK